VRSEDAWEDWLVFFLEGVIAVASSAAETARRIRRLVEREREAIHGLGRGAASALWVHELAGRLDEARILREVTGRRRGRVYVYAAYLELLQAEQ
jgi:hypothetical protein